MTYSCAGTASPLHLELGTFLMRETAPAGAHIQRLMVGDNVPEKSARVAFRRLDEAREIDCDGRWLDHFNHPRYERMNASATGETIALP